MSFLLLVSLCLSIVPLNGLVLAGDSTKLVEVGSAMTDYSFRALTGGDGRLALSDFRGQPVLIVNWTDTDFGRGATGQLEKIAKDLVPKGLVSIIHDSHNKAADAIEASVLRLYPGCPSWRARTHDLPFVYASNGPPPDMALIGVDGTLLVAGSYTSEFSNAVKAIKTELKRAKNGWGLHKTARKARALAFGKLKLSAARAALVKGLEQEPEHEELMLVLDEVVNRCETLKSSVAFLTQQGEYLRAVETAQAFAESVQGYPAWEAEAAALIKGFETDDLQRALKLEKDLLAIIKSLSKSKPKASHVARLKKVAESGAGTALGSRAAHLAEIAQLAVNH